MVVHRLLLMILFRCLHSCVLEHSNHSWCSSQKPLIYLWRMLHRVDKCKLRTLLSVNMSEYKYSSLPLWRPAKANSSSLWGILQCPYHQPFLQKQLVICNRSYYESVLAFPSGYKTITGWYQQLRSFFFPRFIFFRELFCSGYLLHQPYSKMLISARPTVFTLFCPGKVFEILCKSFLLFFCDLSPKKLRN